MDMKLQLGLDDEKLAAIDVLRSGGEKTLRVTSRAMEGHLFKPYKVLDHGLLRVIDYMGDESAIVQAARVSYGDGTKTITEDRGLLRYLMRRRHTTPYEMCEVKWHMKLPIFVARQLIRHRTANVNEYSARYSILANEFYVPEADNIGVQSSTNKQGRGEVISRQQAADVMELLHTEAMRDYDNYGALLNDDGDGKPKDPGKPMIARELARMGLGLNFYTEWYWKIDVHNLLHFLGLRMDPHAQWEIREYADRMGHITSEWLPNVWDAFVDYRFEAAHFARQDLEMLRVFAEAYVKEHEQAGDLTRGEALKEISDRFDLGSFRERKGVWTTLGLAKP